MKWASFENMSVSVIMVVLTSERDRPVTKATKMCYQGQPVKTIYPEQEIQSTMICACLTPNAGRTQGLRNNVNAIY